MELVVAIARKTSNSPVTWNSKWFQRNLRILTINVFHASYPKNKRGHWLKLMAISISMSNLNRNARSVHTLYMEHETALLCYNATSSTKLTSRTCEPAKSSRTGMRSRSSLSWASENQLLIGTACWGWKMYDVGELSIMIVSRRSRPTCERSWKIC